MSRTLLLSLLLGCGLAQAAVDPTQPPANLRPASAEHAPAALELQAILRGAHGSRAVIDGQTLRVGEEHAGLRVLAIHPQSVLIERQGQRELLRLAEPVMKPSR
ncbi:general secretion pathway protein GspB [Pseudomonas sp. ML96]|uniref:general secretion pathway protein GspB n=1 Tax=Pseudomonadaceae TaxID=135621 RepID=UPI000B0CD2CB|nr:general secretion pathway protein GspB [Pseudomonas sp. ML96]